MPVGTLCRRCDGLGYILVPTKQVCSDCRGTKRMVYPGGYLTEAMKKK